jgi:hypothetical protein
VRRIGPLALIATVVVALALCAGAAPGAPSSVIPRASVAVPAVDVLHLFDENEPDENEGGDSGEKGTADRAPSRTRPALTSPAVLAAAGVALAVLVGIALLVRRWVLRYRAFKRELAFQARGFARRLGDDLDRARRRWPR